MGDGDWASELNDNSNSDRGDVLWNETDLDFSSIIRGRGRLMPKLTVFDRTIFPPVLFEAKKSFIKSLREIQSHWMSVDNLRYRKSAILNPRRTLDLIIKHFRKRVAYQGLCLNMNSSSSFLLAFVIQGLLKFFSVFSEKVKRNRVDLFMRRWEWPLWSGRWRIYWNVERVPPELICP